MGILIVSEPVLEAHNFDLTNIITPLNVSNYQKLLEESGFDSGKMEELLDGFTHGFDLGYRGPRDIKIESKNHKLRVGSPLELWTKVIKEVQAKRYAGPFRIPPFDRWV